MTESNDPDVSVADRLTAWPHDGAKAAEHQPGARALVLDLIGLFLADALATAADVDADGRHGAARGPPGTGVERRPEDRGGSLPAPEESRRFGGKGDKT